MKVKLWSIQDENGWKELNSKGILIAKEEFVPPEFKKGYDWLKIQMTQRIGKPKNSRQYPIWAWFQHDTKDKKRPDLRSTGHLPKGKVGYRIEIEKDLKEIVLSDFVLWHWPLCYMGLITNSEKEIIEFEKEFGIISSFDDFNILPKSIKNKIEKSWEKIFNINFDLKYYTLPFDEKSIQATFWELKREEVIKVDKFTAR